MPKPKREYTALEFTANRRFSNNWFLGGSYVVSKLFGNYAGLVNTDEVTYPGRVSNVSQQAAGQRTRPGTNASRAYDLDQMMFDSHGDFVYGRLPTDRPHVVKAYGAYQFGMGTQIGAFFYGGSGTPITTNVVGQDQYAHFDSWHGWRELLSRVTLAVAGRAGELPRPAARLMETPHQIELLPLPPMEISATEIRARVARHEPIDALVPPEVARYIAQHRLYLAST